MKKPRRKYFSDDDESELEEDLYRGQSEDDDNDEDVYFGHGKDEDGDFDDDGNPLRPKLKKAKKRSKGEEDYDDAENYDEKEEDVLADERVQLPWSKSKDDVEYDDLFGKGIRTKKPTKSSILF